MPLRVLGLAAAGLLCATPVFAQVAVTTGDSLQTSTGASATSAGSAGAGVTSAATWGTGTTLDGSSAASVGGSAFGGHVRFKQHLAADNLSGQSTSQAMDQGTFSKSRTRVSVDDGEITTSTTSMAHVPGAQPVKSTTTIQTLPPPR